jgi:hypothetical protein
MLAKRFIKKKLLKNKILTEIPFQKVMSYLKKEKITNCK